MSAPRGSCPSLLAPMQSGDGLLLRVKPRAATLTADQAARMAAGAARYGNGIVELTNRGHLQLRGFKDPGVEDFAGEMARIGLAAAEPGAEAVRNVLADPLGPDDPGAAFDSHRLAHRLSAMLEGDPALHALPHKFGLLVDAGAALPLAEWRADIVLRAAGTGIGISLDSGDRMLVVPPEGVEDAVRRLLGAFLSWMAKRDTPAPRMRAMIAACGAAEVFGAAGSTGEAAAPCGTAPARPCAGFTALAGGGCFQAGAPFGAIDAAALAALAGIARRFADGTIRIAPWKAAVLCGVALENVEAIRDAAAEAGFVVEPDDPRQRIVACAGRPRCPSAHADTRADAARLVAMGAVPAGLVHLSGCAKGCAHPGPAPVALVAGEAGYGLVRGGRPGDVPAPVGLTLAQAASALSGPAP